MFAVIKTGGKQYKVAKDDTIVVETIGGAPGSTVEINDVLMIGGGKEPQLDALDKAAVFAEVVEQTKAPKVIVFKKKRRKNYRRKAGHRQNLTLLRITGISATGTRPARAAAKAKKAPSMPEAQKKAKGAPKKPAPKKPAAKKPAPKKPAAKKPAAKKPAAKKPAAKKKSKE